MSFNYKDLTYIRAALQHYESSLTKVTPDECDEDEFSETQDDIMYISRLIAMTQLEIDKWENKKPNLSIVKDDD